MSPISLLHGNITEQVIGSFLVVYKDLGFGFLENPYCNALAVELGARGLRVVREVPAQIHYRGVLVGSYRFDLLVESKVLVEVKSTKLISEADERQLLNYLKASDIEVGLLLHFGPTPKYKRFVFSNSRKRNK